ncbi:MAG: TolC family protein [Phycisphaerales bacterium]|nr:MAG: TolC family protein [Phycisphaerales bacterium]
MALVNLTGCATYERRPLELLQYAKDWPLRDISLDTIRAYAEELARDEKHEPYDPSDGLSLAEAEAAALVFNPQLRLARAQAEVPLASAREAGWWPDPEFEAAVLRFVDRGTRTRYRFARGEFTGVDASAIGPSGINPGAFESLLPGLRKVPGDFVEKPWIVDLGLSITIPVSGRLAVEKDWAWAEYSAAWRHVLIAEWEMLTRLRSTWLAWSATHGRIAVTAAHLEQLGTVVTMADRLAGAGELKPTDARMLLVELRRQRAALQALKSEAEQQRLELFAILGVAPEAPVELQPDLFLPRIGVPPESRRATLLQRDPRILAVRAEYEAAEQRLRLEVRNQYPDLSIGPSYSLEEGLSRLGFGFGLPIPLWNHNRQAVAEAIAERDAVRARARVHTEQVFSELCRAEARLRHAAQRREMLLDEVAPLVDRQVAETRKLLDLGEANVLVLRDALSSAVETKLELLAATLTEAQAANALQQMLEPRWMTPSQAAAEEDDE